mgnify:CR=1 FL=1
MSALAVLDPRAAFVDVGSEKMHVSIGGGLPRVFGTVTSQLEALRDFLIEGHDVLPETLGNAFAWLDDLTGFDEVIVALFVAWW